MTRASAILLLPILCHTPPAPAMGGSPHSQQVSPTPQSPFAQLIAEYLHRAATGHSPSATETAAMGTLTPTPKAADIQEALPLLLQALASDDTSLRTFSLTTLVGLAETTPQPAPATTKEVPAAIPSYKPEVAHALIPAVPAVLTHLFDEAPENRHLTVSFAAAFTGHAPPSLFSPLLAYLKTDPANSPTGVEVTATLLSLGPVSPDTSSSIARFLRRPDQRDLRPDLAETIAAAPNQSRDLNATLLKYLDSDDPSLRARVILSLPALDLAPDAFADTKTRVAQLAENPNENLQVVTAAKAVAPCWTTLKMSTGCPIYQ